MLNIKYGYLNFYSGYILTIVLLIAACSEKNKSSDSIDSIEVAQYKNKKLYFSQVKDIVQIDGSKDDSVRIINSIVDRWLKDQIMVEKSKVELKNIENIESLVDNYRAELLLLAYKDLLTSTKLDSNLNEEEINVYYQSNKSNYKLQNSIFRCLFVKLPKPVVNKDQFDQWWKNLNSTSLQQLTTYCQNNAEVCLLNSEKWYTWIDMKKLLPKTGISESDIIPGLRREFADFKYQYALKIFEVVNPNEVPPLSFVKDQAKRVILQQRADKLWENIRKENYEQELKAQNVKIFTN